MLNTTGPRRDPRSIIPITGLQAEFKDDPLTTTHWAPLSNQFLNHLVVHPCWTIIFQSGYKNIVGDHIINLAEVKAPLASPPTLIYSFCHGRQSSRSSIADPWHTHTAVRSHCLLLHVPRNVLREDFLYDLRKDQSEDEFVEDGTCHYGLLAHSSYSAGTRLPGKGFHTTFLSPILLYMWDSIKLFSKSCL